MIFKAKTAGKKLGILNKVKLYFMPGIFTSLGIGSLMYGVL